MSKQCVQPDLVRKKRNPYFDFLKGISIMMVLANHTFPHNVSFESIEGFFIILVRQIINCAVPVFLAISGYFIGKKDFSNPKLKFDFFKRQIPKVYIPCLIYSLGWFALEIYANAYDNFALSLLKFFACGFSVYYFIILIIQLYLLAPLMKRHNSLRGG